MKDRNLPKWVTCYRDRHGQLRYRFRRTGYPQHHFAAPFPSKEFEDEYRAALGELPLGAGIMRNDD